MHAPLSPWALLALVLSAAPVRAQVPADDDAVHAVAETMPSFPGGTAALRTYLARNFRFPQEVSGAVVNGPVLLSFVVLRNGLIRDAHVVRGQHPALDAEALRLVGAMPPWEPGRQQGRPVNVLYSMPIRFALPPAPPPQPPLLVEARPDSKRP